jgi:Uri superfamily endonuclease
LTRGVYSLLIELEEGRAIELKRGVCWRLPKGYYVYTGSALGRGSTSLEKRLERHLSVNKKTYWHIDRLLDGSARVVRAVYAEAATRMECKLNQKISSLLRAKAVKGFGSSDCKYGCVGHLLYPNPLLRDLSGLLRRAFCELGLKYREKVWHGVR